MRLNWNEWYQLAKKYYEFYGNLLVPQKFKTKNGYEYDLDGYTLGRWITNQRDAYLNIDVPKFDRKNTSAPLEPVQIKLLEEIGMIFDVFRYNWDNIYKLAKNYYQYYGNLLVPRNFKTKNGYEYDLEGYNLGHWIIYQRVAYKNTILKKEKGNRNTAELTKEQIELLEEIGMIFDVRKTGWNNMYKLAQNYYNHYGNLLVPRSFKTKDGYNYDEKGYGLGNWIKDQRIAYSNIGLSKEEYKQNLGPLTLEQIIQLEDIGMIFNTKNNSKKSIELCKLYNLNYKKYNYLIKRISYKELNAKINFLISKGYQINIDRKPNGIFFMDDINLQMLYGISKKELIEKYYNEENKKVI